MLILTDTVNTFNDGIKKLRALLGHLFPVDLLVLPELSRQTMNSLGVDVALISKVKMINKRVLEVNPRYIGHHCGNHRAALVPTDTLRNSERHKLTHDISCKLYNLINASPKFEDLFRECQILTQECDQFKGKKPVTLSDQPMYIFVLQITIIPEMYARITIINMVGRILSYSLFRCTLNILTFCIKNPIINQIT